jgi:hypothetical protein
MVTALLAASTSRPAVSDAALLPLPRTVVAYDAPEIEGSLPFEARDVPPLVGSSAPDAVDPFPGRTYGNLPGSECLEALEVRAIAFTRPGHARGVETPVRLMGPLHGITFRGESVDWETSARREVLDCRLVLALDDLAALLAAHGVIEVLHLGIYRGDVPIHPHERPLHHVAGLAIDVAAFVKTDGARLEVRRDFHGRVGARTCAASGGLPTASTTGTAELRGIRCDVADGKTFHQVLTPNHDARHRDHFHLEVMRRTEWTMVE